MSLENLDSVQQWAAVIESNQHTAYFHIASLTVLVYDYLLTLQLEVNLIWGMPWNVGKILFFLTRYIVFIETSMLAYFHISDGGITTTKTCRSIYQASGWMIFGGTVVAEFVLVLRTWAIWGQSRKIAFGLIALMFILAIPVIYLTFVGEESVEFVQRPTFLTQRCLISKVGRRTIFLDYVVVVALETVILILTLIKGIEHYRYSQSNVMKALYKDGLLYYVYLTATSVANVCVYAYVDKTHGASLILPQRVFHSIFTARILLHLRLAIMRHRKAASPGSKPEALPTVVARSRLEQLSSLVFGTEIWYSPHERPQEQRHSRVNQV